MPTDVYSPPKFLTVGEAADAMHVREAVICGAIRDGELPAAKVGRRWLIDPADFTAYVRRHRTDAPAPTAAPVGEDTWLAETLAKFTADDLRRAGEIFRAIADAASATAVSA
ncbi:helix-turn-helix domain-containing protein [Mycolicibacter arupensis]|uniref:helix-turn-helix domain-containing protein n=1 Tax=Mycolicibacter arupensis TaxID=342002 RepID=UPI00165F8316|nr:helix-turn-helix domain-containing protein [Mycolicibacter arupensis]